MSPTQSDRYVLALDQGTTSSRALLFDRSGSPIGVAQQEFPQYTPAPGHVEHQPDEIWESQIAVAKRVVAESGVTPEQIESVGITNQRETTVLWDRQTGKAVAPAIVWQSRITADACDRLKRDGVEPTVRAKTGLLLDPYFSGTKIGYLLEQDTSLRAKAERGDVLFGTVDSYLVWRLTNGKRHVTDYSNASRTLLLNLETLDWDPELLDIFNVPRAMLPELVPNSGICGEISADLLGRPLPIAGLAGDQQSATFGQCCFEPGQAKNTYGTGCFMLMNVGGSPLPAPEHLLATVGWVIDGTPVYCFEGSIFVGGAIVQWLRDGLRIIDDSASVETLARTVDDSGDVVLVPALTGLGAPYWDPDARGGILGITRGTNQGHIARAALESMAHQTCDILDVMQQTAGEPLTQLRVDGGATANNLLMQMQADLLGVTVQRPSVLETTALGAAYLAGLATGFWPDRASLASHWRVEREFEPACEVTDRDRQRRHWAQAVQRCLKWARQS